MENGLRACLLSWRQIAGRYQYKTPRFVPMSTAGHDKVGTYRFVSASRGSPGSQLLHIARISTGRIAEDVSSAAPSGPGPLLNQLHHRRSTLTSANSQNPASGERCAAILVSLTLFQGRRYHENHGPMAISKRGLRLPWNFRRPLLDA